MAQSESGQTRGVETIDIPLVDLHADDDFNCRGPIAPIDVVDLARSMASATGLLSPIIVQPYDEKHRQLTGKKFRIVAGYRRFKAASLNEWETIPCIVREGLTDVQARIINLGENLGRKNLNILQEAKAISHLLMLGQEDVARHLSQSRGWVQVRQYLLTMPEPIQQEAAAGVLTQQQIRDLYALHSDTERFEAVKRIKAAKLTGEKAVKVKKKTISPFTRKPRDRTEIFAMMEHIQDAIGNNFGTRCLAWGAGEISDADLYRDIKELADEQDKPYSIPREALSSMSPGIASY